MGKKLALRWMRIADRDLALATHIQASFPDSAAFHFQQAAEKYLVAFLALHQVELKKSRNISTLALQACRIDPEFSILATIANLDDIAGFETLYLYPNEQHEEFPAQSALDSARALCLKIQEMVESRITMSASVS